MGRKNKPKKPAREGPVLYGQRGIDGVLLKCLDGMRTGVFVDVGAHDGSHFSNTRMFEELGWTGVCVEANPISFCSLIEARPRSTCVLAACAERGGISPFHIHPGNMNSTIDVVGYSKWRRDAGRKGGIDPLEYRGIMVGVATLDVILSAANIVSPLDLLSIDVERAESRVLSGFDVQKWSPRVVVIEAHTKGDVAELKECLHPNDYHVAYFKSPNVIFCRDAADASRLL